MYTLKLQRLFIPGEATEISHYTIHPINLSFCTFSPATILGSVNTQIKHTAIYYSKSKILQERKET